MRHAFLIAVLGLTTLPSLVHAGPCFAIGLNFGVPCYRPYYGYGYYGYGYGYPPVYLAAPPVVVAPGPIYPAPRPVVAVSADTPVPETPPPPPAVPAPPSVVRAARASGEEFDLSPLNDPSPKTRADACIRLGRAKEGRAVGSLVRCLNEDDSPQVRDAAARGLGLIGSTKGLDALQKAAGADADRDVRRSASFAAEVIRANLER